MDPVSVKLSEILYLVKSWGKRSSVVQHSADYQSTIYVNRLPYIHTCCTLYPSLCLIYLWLNYLQEQKYIAKHKLANQTLTDVCPKGFTIYQENIILLIRIGWCLRLELDAVSRKKWRTEGRVGRVVQRSRASLCHMACSAFCVQVMSTGAHSPCSVTPMRLMKN